jgi:RNA polymerase sigma-70 factor (ECF subfamily)
MSGGTDTFKADLLGSLANLRAFAMSLSGSSSWADDLVQETVMKAWAKRHTFTPGTNLRAWLFTILRNTYFSDLRKRRRETEDADGALAGRLATPPEQLAKMDFADFMVAFATLSENQREALVLIGAEGFSYEEAAEITGCAVGTIKSRVNRARARLAEIMDIGSVDEFGADKNSLAIVAWGNAWPVQK